jgi:hypothetical protein
MGKYAKIHVAVNCVRMALRWLERVGKRIVLELTAPIHLREWRVSAAPLEPCSDHSL